jgi:succinoglycan biosynthesis transport protein ExoP
MEQVRIANDESDVIDLREILAILRKRYLVIVVLTFVALVTSGILSFFVLSPIYETKVLLRVNQAAPNDPTYSYTKGEGLEGMMNTISQLPEMTINTYIGQLESEAVMERVVKKLKLDQTGYTAGSLAGIVSVVAVKDTNLIELKVTNTDPYLATKIANTLTSEFLDFMSMTNEQQMGKSVEFLKKQVVANDKELKTAVTGLNNMEAQPRGPAIISQMIETKSTDLSKYQSQILQVNLEYQQALAGRQQAEVQMQSTPPTIKTSKDDKATGGTVEVDVVNPSYTELQTMINTKIIAAAEKTAELRSLQTIITSLTEELKSLQAELAQKKNTQDLAKKEVERLQETNSLLRSKIDETQIGRSLKFGETSLVVVSPAMVPDGPIKPKKMLNMAVALVLGLMVSVGLAFLLNYLDNTVKTPKDVEDNLGLPILGQIPFYNIGKPEAVRR